MKEERLDKVKEMRNGGWTVTTRCHLPVPLSTPYVLTRGACWLTSRLFYQFIARATCRGQLAPAAVFCWFNLLLLACHLFDDVYTSPPSFLISLPRSVTATAPDAYGKQCDGFWWSRIVVHLP